MRRKWIFPQTRRNRCARVRASHRRGNDRIKKTRRSRRCTRDTSRSDAARKGLPHFFSRKSKVPSVPATRNQRSTPRLTAYRKTVMAIVTARQARHTATSLCHFPALPLRTPPMRCTQKRTVKRKKKRQSPKPGAANSARARSDIRTPISPFSAERSRPCALSLWCRTKP